MWIGFFYAMKMCGFLNVRFPTVPTEKFWMNDYLYTPYHFTVNINLIKELKRRRKPISRLSKHPKLTYTMGQKSFWGLFEVSLRSFWGLFEVFLGSFFLRKKEEANLKSHTKLTCTLGSKVCLRSLFEVSLWGLSLRSLFEVLFWGPSLRTILGVFRVFLCP